jgi:hypothetical protein
MGKQFFLKIQTLNKSGLTETQTMATTEDVDWWYKRLWNMKEEFSDVTINCFNSKKISANKNILSASSSLLHRLCSVSSEISFSEAPIKTVENLLKFIYLDEVPNDKDLYNDFFMLAKKLKVLGFQSLKSFNNQSGSLVSQSDSFDNQSGCLSNQYGSSESKKRKVKPDDDDPQPGSSKKRKIVPEVSTAKLEPVKKLHNKGITDLPNELLLKVFSYVSTSDMMGKVALVSNRFNQLNKDPESHVALHFPQKRTYYELATLKQFLAKKNKIQEVHLPCIPKENLDTFLDLSVWQQKLTTVISTGNFNCESGILKLLADRPDKARQLRKLIIIKERSDFSVAIPALGNLTHLEANFSDDRSFDCLLTYATATMTKLNCLASSTTLRHSKLFGPFLTARQTSLTKLDLPGYKCSVTDFVLLTSLCTQLEMLNVDCKKVSQKHLVKVANLRNLSDLGMAVSSKEFCPELIAACMEINSIKDFNVESNESSFELENFTELKVHLCNDIIKEKDISKFLPLQITNLKLRYSAKSMQNFSPFDKLEKLTDLYMAVYQLAPDTDYILKELDMIKRKNLKTYKTRMSNFYMSYTTNSVDFTLAQGNETYPKLNLSKVLEKLEILNLKKLILTGSQFKLDNATLQSIFFLKTLQTLHLNFKDFEPVDNIAKKVFKNLENLDLLIIDCQRDQFEVAANMCEHGLKIKKGNSTVFFKNFGCH